LKPTTDLANESSPKGVSPLDAKVEKQDAPKVIKAGSVEAFEELKEKKREKTAARLHKEKMRRKAELPEWMQDKTPEEIEAIEEEKRREKQAKAREKGNKAFLTTLGSKLHKEEEVCEFKELVDLSRKYNITLDELKIAREEFAIYDVGQKGEISRDEFQRLVRARCNLPTDKSLPMHLVSALGKSRDDEGNAVTFEDFLLWTIHCAYAEELMVPDPYERHIRALARQQGMLLPDVEKIKKVFDGFDTDGSGEIEEDEFKHILYKLMNVKNTADVSEKKLQRYWRELDSSGDGSCDFDEFLVWFATLFPTSAINSL